MVQLDASAFNVVLTPESAISSVQHAVNSKNWKQSTLSDIKLVYTPFYVFSFDVTEGNVPTGKAALNAATGEISDFVPYLLDRPLEKSKKTDDKAEVEVEPSTISQNEVKDLAAVKIANAVGAKKDQVVISAISKIYVPFYRIWVDVAGDSFKIEVDACLGNPTGLDAIPVRPKNWEENTQETLKQMQTPTGLVNLTSKTIAEASKVGGPQTSNKYVQWAVLGVIIIVVAYFAFGNVLGSATCTPSSDLYSKPAYFGLFGPKKVVPKFDAKNQTYTLYGSCSFTTRDKQDHAIMFLTVKQGGIPISGATQTFTTALSPQPTLRNFAVTWNASNSREGDYVIEVKQLA